jgi:hypothetical protein
VLGIVPLSELLDKHLQSRRKEPKSLLSDHQKHITHRRLCSNSQHPKRRQLAYIARNRAVQLIVVQEPAKSTKEQNLSVQTTKNQKHITHRRLCSNSQALKQRQLAHGARNRAAQSIVVQTPAKSKSVFRPTQRRPLLRLTALQATIAGSRC